MLRISSEHDLEVGDTVRIIPNHVRSTVNPYNKVLLTDDAGGVERLEVFARGKLE